MTTGNPKNTDDVPPPPQQPVMFNSDMATLNNIALSGVENAILAFLCLRKLENPARRWTAREIADAKGLLYTEDTVHTAVSNLKKTSPKAKPGVFELACDNNVTIVYWSKKFNQGYKLVLRVRLIFIHEGKIDVLEPDPPTLYSSWGSSGQ